ncbi:hypothetical protein DORI_88 [Mycobacterium phage Dori]|uniref:hypothetical protein n=1 Tax=Mycobacterium phage Dori TaxID=1089121 RepID=UPI000232F58E|nr:hypothetical protein DORI_88 [Mycobacterium phage Dori]AER47737.1 hypothetical protein DORI_88 [Mycobacterium phage Dori]
MTPAPSDLGGALPSRSEIEQWPTQHLEDAAAQLRRMGAQSVTLFDEHRQNIAAPGGTTWEGDAKDAALDRVTADTAVVRRQTTVQDEAANIAENGAHDVRAAKRDVLAAITEAENDGFSVAEDLTVTDTRATDLETMAARQTAAIEHAEDIRWYADRLIQADNLIAQRLQEKAAELEGIRFDGESQGRDSTVQLVDNETENPDTETETEPNEGTGDATDPDTDNTDQGGADSPVDDGPKSPHPDYPNRNKDGTYSDGNTVDGKAAEKAALDNREDETGIPLERRQVRATHPDVTNPKTGKPQQRYYDALEPTDNPDEYIGIEAKTNENAHRSDQERFDDAVTPERPATATLDGREIRIVDTDVVYPPEGWDEAPAESDAPTDSGGAEAKVPGPSLPPGLTDPGAGGFGGVHAEGTVPVGPAPANAPNYPGWGTQLTPQEMISSDDPALRVAGQAILEQMQREGKIDPSSTA